MATVKLTRVRVEALENNRPRILLQRRLTVPAFICAANSKSSPTSLALRSAKLNKSRPFSVSMLISGEVLCDRKWQQTTGQKKTVLKRYQI